MFLNAMLLVASVELVSCGSEGPTSNAAIPVTPVDAVAIDAQVQPDAAPRRWAARAELDPVKGSRVEIAFIVFMQIEGERTSVASSSPVKGLAPGKYQFVVHEGHYCGENATEAGAPWSGAAGFEVPKKSAAVAINIPGVPLALDGDQTIVGRTLVLHADAKGSPGRVLACGAIFSRSTSSP